MLSDEGATGEADERETGVTEKLKEENQLMWVRMMNNISSCAEEIILRELVYI